MENFIEKYKNRYIDEGEVLLYENDSHRIYWIGIEEENAFRCNVYLIQDADEFLIVDPGSRLYHQELKQRVANITDPKQVKGLILCHQDPDVAASMVDWIDLNPDIEIITSERTNILLPYYGRSNYHFYNASEHPYYTFTSGNRLKFITAPFLHFPGAITILDLEAKFLFSGDIFAAIDIDWKLIVDEFESHKANMDLFQKDYMASNRATRGYVRKIRHEAIEAILPQHGSIISKDDVPQALEYFQNLECGLDIIYPDLD
ncbi:MBL fold metallo-hydrolase [Nitratifractor sp.]|uniref:MBL fold metallo-hydrolase n=1 Tax=Nitratifractor sp. TaxID=2268144 RepID=UPI0025FC0CC7|nr:MBL fold metallo-hydrolase [Nitratifractor sp.]